MQLDNNNAKKKDILGTFFHILHKFGKMALSDNFFQFFSFFGLFIRNLQQKSGYNLMITPKTFQIPKIQY